MPIGLTADECNAVLQAFKPGTSSISCRFPDLKRLGYIEQARHQDGTPMERPTSSDKGGRIYMARVYVLTKRGRSALTAQQLTFPDLGDISARYHGGDDVSKRTHRARQKMGHMGLQLFRTLQAIGNATPNSYFTNPPPKKPQRQLALL